MHIHSIELRKFTPGLFPEVPYCALLTRCSRVVLVDTHGWSCNQQAEIHVACEAGTYIRSIARECGEALVAPATFASLERQGADAALYAGGTLAALERSRSGIFGLDTSVDFDELRRLLEVRLRR